MGAYLLRESLHARLELEDGIRARRGINAVLRKARENINDVGLAGDNTLSLLDDRPQRHALQLHLENIHHGCRAADPLPRETE